MTDIDMLIDLARGATSREEIETLCREVVSSTDARAILRFMRVAPQHERVRLGKRIVALGDAEVIDRLAQEMPGVYSLASDHGWMFGLS